MYLPGTPLIHNLHLKAKVRFPDSFFLLYYSSLTSKEKIKTKPNNPKTNINQKKKKSNKPSIPGSFAPHPPGSDLRSPNLCRVQSPAPTQMTQGGIPQPDKLGMPLQPLQRSLTIHQDFSITPQTVPNSPSV